MTENTENGNGTDKREIVYHPAIREFDNTKNLITNIGFTAKADEKFEILWPIPESDDECMERYDCKLAVLTQAGVRQFSTRPDYKLVGFDDDGELKDGGHEAMQELADGYKVGARVVGVSQKKIVADVKAAEVELGMSHEQMVATLKEMKEAGQLD